MNERIGKIQSNPDAYKIEFFFYNRARDAMFDIVNELFGDGYKDIYIPGYIGWSSKEGSGIFDPLNLIAGLVRHYYHMSKKLTIDLDSVRSQLKPHSILLIVNYFGFRDPCIGELIRIAHENNCVVIEDNAHGFYTYFYYGSMGADMTFFSLHKMFPFKQGGGLIVENNKSYQLHSLEMPVDFNPFAYNYNKIAKVRTKNYKALSLLITKYKKYFEPLRSSKLLERNIPQTFPIIIKQGKRDNIYEIMNEAGYGVVSLYHTMIEELRCEAHSDAMWLSQRVMNLPVHQDVDGSLYQSMVDTLIKACEMTK